MPATAPWSTAGPLSQLVTIVTGLTGVQQVYTGIPESVEKRLCAFVTLGGQDIANKTTGGLMQRMQSYRVVFVYAVEEAEAGAELAVAAVIDLLLDALFADRTLNGTLEQMEVDATEADRPEYARVAGVDYRQYPITIRGVQRKTYPV